MTSTRKYGTEFPFLSCKLQHFEIERFLFIDPGNCTLLLFLSQNLEKRSKSVIMALEKRIIPTHLYDYIYPEKAGNSRNI